MSDFTLQDQIDALKYVLQNHGLRFVSIDIDTDEIDGSPVYTFVYGEKDIIGKFQYKRLVGEIDDLITGEIKRLQDVGIPK